MRVYCFALLMRKRTRERIRLIRILVAMGKYILKFPRSITMSPGSFPGNGSFGTKCIMTPAMTSTRPVMIKNFPIFKNINTGECL